MKITAITTANFIGASSVDVKLAKPVALFAGKNFAGKSSVQEAVRMALTGESVRVGLKKDYGALITEGQDAGFAEVVTADRDALTAYSVVLPSGKGNHSDNAALPYVLDAQRFARLEPNERRSFLFGLMGVKTNGDEVRRRLIDRLFHKVAMFDADHARIDKIVPFLRAGFDAACKEAQAKARECKAQWKTVTGGETYGSNKAASFVFEKPEVDAKQLEQARADLVAIEVEIETETARLGEMQGNAKQAAAQSGRLEELREKASRFARIQGKLNIDEAELKQWQAKVEETRQKASGAKKEDEHMTCPHCAGMVKWDNGELVKHTGWPFPAPAEVTEAAAKLPEYEKSLAVLQNAVNNGKRDLAEANAAAAALAELENGTLVEAPNEDAISAIKTRIETIKHGKKNQDAAIRLLEEATRRAAEADEKTKRAAALHVDVQQWEAIGDALAPDGIPGEMLAEALEPINARLLTSAGVAEWEQAVIHSDMRITMGLRDYTLLSESEKWRTDAMIAEAVSHLSGVRLLVLDRFDVLDLKGREDLLYWLDGMALDGEIDTALIFGTLKGLPAQLPESVEAFWIENGSAGQIAEAA